MACLLNKLHTTLHYKANFSLFIKRQPPLEHSEVAVVVAGEGHLDAVAAHLDARGAVGARGQLQVREDVAPRLGERQV